MALVAEYGTGMRVYHFPAVHLGTGKNITFYISRWFGMTACKMASKRHRQRQECKELLKMISSKTAMMRVHGEYVQQSRKESRVVRGNLKHQLQIAYALRDA